MALRTGHRPDRHQTARPLELATGTQDALRLLHIGVFAVIFFIAFGQLFASQIVSLVQAAPSIIQNVIDWLNARFNLGLNPQTIIDQLNLSPRRLASSRNKRPVACWSVLSSAIGIVFQGFTLLLFAFYFAADGPGLRRFVASLLRASSRPCSTTSGPSPPTRPAGS